ncbi:MAG: ATP-grasp domain-containing protein [Mesorhizobium sp.]|uniref:ATP-grasp domain-containing protein n=1 Tax=Mesorhizobium sp. TaxID=1871066 RepID=UPI0011FFA733|nr:acetyl-CoA carboxylase biotin carboxylase subunit family protein [Mesorhizobium sp.]TIO86508.1 MAG: ATP-grasp domain-containing protein [Mesorhizobium sp.]TIQ34131.1 MAG: ATP-grasp domain-containing protein [Mesorhizobium sp.]TIR15392.1 MAG: ATP-grasp domain-containing protein [Mesorhizobium sp.]
MTRRALILVEGHRGNGPRYVQAAQRLGLHPITLSTDPAQYEYLAAEMLEAIRVDTDNLDALIRECSRIGATYDIAGITGFALLDESIYATVGKLCRHFDLPGPNPASIERCCDKFAQRQFLADAGVPIPAYRLAADARDVERAAAEIGLPVVLKPAVGSGSVGVRLCRNADELAEHTTYLLGGKHTWRSSPRILIEEFAQGPHYYVPIMGNELIGIEASDCPPPHFVFHRGIFPALLTHDEHKRIAKISLSCLRALGLGWGPTNIEFRWTKRGPVVIEVNPRLGAGAPTVQLAYGVDLVTEHIKLVIGEEWNLRRRHSHTVAWRSLLPDRDGILDWITGDSRAAAIPGVAEVKLYVKPKTSIVRKGDYRDCIGHIKAVSTSPARSEAILQRAVDSISWSITPFPTSGGEKQSAALQLPAPTQVAPGKR